jgi:hypothetical protein
LNWWNYMLNLTWLAPRRLACCFHRHVSVIMNTYPCATLTSWSESDTEPRATHRPCRHFAAISACETRTKCDNFKC